jgi:carboxypeptidase T
VIAGTAPPGVRLTVSKRFSLDTSAIDGTRPVSSFPMRLQSTMTVPASGRFRWHVNPSPRPSQYASAHLDEAWTITCGPGRSGAIRAIEATVERGGTAQVDMSRCPRGPKVR